MGDVFHERKNLADIKRQMGIPQAIDNYRCNDVIGCGRQLTHAEIVNWSQLTFKEYRLSGLCNKCQNEVFTDPDMNGCTCATPCCEVDVGVGIITCQGQHCPQHGDIYRKVFEERRRRTMEPNYKSEYINEWPPNDKNME